jgi:hypothetical protein
MKNQMTRSVRIVGWFLALLLLNLTACKKEEDKVQPNQSLAEKPGQIPGCGEMPGPPEGRPFVLPKNVSIKGPIIGVDDGPGQEDCVYDGAGFWVTVKMELQNDSTGPVTVEFPAGLVLTTTTKGFQHGLLLERVLVTLPPKVEGGRNCQVTLMASCLNAHLEPANLEANFTLGPITSSPLLKDFIQKLSTKKTLFISDYQKSDDFFPNQEAIQDALWALTDGDGLSERDLERIRNLPNK